MGNIVQCQEVLLAKAKQKGFLTFDDILNTSDDFSLSITETDTLSENIQYLGVVVYEISPVNTQNNDEDVLDYSRTDYEAIFNEVVNISPETDLLIEEIKRSPIPQYGEISLLAPQAAEGNEFARERMIIIYMRNVIKIALSMTKQYELDLEEAISSGFIGLISAVDRFDPDGFSAFHSYAAMWIQQSIQRYCTSKWIDFYFPAHYKTKIFKVFPKYESITSGEKVDSEEYYFKLGKIAGEYDLSAEEIDSIIKQSLYQKYGRMSIDEFCISEHDFIDSMDIDYLTENYFEKELSYNINLALESLKAREADVLKMRFGIGNKKPMTLEEIGNIMNVTRERVRQIEAKALKKLASKPSTQYKLKSFLI